MHIQCPIPVVIVPVVPASLASSRVPVALGAAVESHGLCPVGFTQSVPSGLKMQGSRSRISFMTPHPVGGRTRVSWGPRWLSPPVLGVTPRCPSGHPGQCCLPRTGAGPLQGQCPCTSRSCPASSCPSSPKKCPGGRKGQILYVRYGKRLLAGEVQPGTALPSLGTAERERSSAAWLEWAHGAPILFAFDCYGLLFSGKVAAAPVGLLS